MVENKKIYAAVQVALDFREKFMELCSEYCDKMQEVCPEDIISKNRTYESTVKLLTRLQFNGENFAVSKNELEQAGYALDFSSDEAEYYKKEVNGIGITYNIDAD
ncbi:MAG: hypothetical protein NC253_03080 [Ruminococcus sp.]|nr:hypothetical protein [Ruminococcus sp.]MCM1380379.1 hypothetical protein [Muribaculaceae bacterium]MCM1478311.1 hypothetical protein [Muribaculaceae bacterium]